MTKGYFVVRAEVPAEADRALRQALAADGGDTETLVRRALQLLTHG